MSARVLVLALALVASGAVLAAGTDVDRVRVWLERVQAAGSRHSYDGTFVYVRGDEVSTMRLIHSVRDGRMRERLISLDGNGREVIRTDDLVTCILPDRKAVVVEKARPKGDFPPSFPTRIDDLVAYYDFDVDETCRDRVAGLATVKITISPRDGYRYGYHLWVDRRTGLLLKSHLLDERMQPVEKFMFTHLTYLDEVPEKWLEPGIKGDEFTWYRAEDPPGPGHLRQTREWVLTDVPPGFRLTMHSEHRPARARQVREHLLLSDGLAVVTVYIEDPRDGGEKAPEEENLVGGSRMGAVSAWGRLVDGHHVTVMGVVPLATVKRIAHAVRYER